MGREFYRFLSAYYRGVATDEYFLDNPTVRSFVDAVRGVIAEAPSPADAVERIRPTFAELLADPDWLPDTYREAAPESGMGGGIGQWLLYRAGDGSLSLFSLVVPAGAGAPLPHPPAWGAVGPSPGPPDAGGFSPPGGGIGLRGRPG